MADVQLFAMLTQDSAFCWFPPGAGADETKLLAALELEALRWTMEGKTVWEIGLILAKSERSVASYLSCAAQVRVRQQVSDSGEGAEAGFDGLGR